MNSTYLVFFLFMITFDNWCQEGVPIFFSGISDLKILLALQEGSKLKIELKTFLT